MKWRLDQQSFLVKKTKQKKPKAFNVFAPTSRFSSLNVLVVSCETGGELILT